MSRKDYDRATLQGIAARQAGNKPDANPYRNKPALLVLSDAWLAGWQSQDGKMRGSR